MVMLHKRFLKGASVVASYFGGFTPGETTKPVECVVYLSWYEDGALKFKRKLVALPVLYIGMVFNYNDDLWKVTKFRVYEDWTIIAYASVWVPKFIRYRDGENWDIQELEDPKVAGAECVEDDYE